jgi:Sulfotransferase family
MLAEQVSNGWPTGAQMNRHIILLMGLPRSGTTWVAKILDSDPHTVYRHEPDRGTTLKSMPLAPNISESQALRPAAEAFASRLLNITKPHVVGSQPKFPKVYRSRVVSELYNWNVKAARIASAARIKVPIFSMVDWDKFPDLSVVWKSVGSIGRLGVFVRVLENPHAIILLRHPCGHVASVLRGEAQRKFAYPPSEDYGMFEILLNTEPARRRRLKLDQLMSMHPTERLAWRWVILYEKALNDTEGIDRCMSIRYEDICAEPEKHARRVMEFCGLSWGNATADFVKNSTSAEDKRYYSVFKNPLRSAMRWQADLSTEDIDRIYRVVGESDLLRLYPREPEYEHASSTDKILQGD